MSQVTISALTTDAFISELPAQFLADLVRVLTGSAPKRDVLNFVIKECRDRVNKAGG
jgi:hypothetical protein